MNSVDWLPLFRKQSGEWLVKWWWLLLILWIIGDEWIDEGMKDDWDDSYT
jgi:hypothetical protein